VLYRRVVTLFPFLKSKVHTIAYVGDTVFNSMKFVPNLMKIGQLI